jgi:hypothetical protein
MRRVLDFRTDPQSLVSRLEARKSLGLTEILISTSDAHDTDSVSRDELGSHSTEADLLCTLARKIDTLV